MVKDIGAFYVKGRLRIPLTRVKSDPKKGEYSVDERQGMYTISRADMRRKIEYVYRVQAER